VWYAIPEPLVGSYSGQRCILRSIFFFVRCVLKRSERQNSCQFLLSASVQEGLDVR
jgi:hypothetical protein